MNSAYCKVADVAKKKWSRLKFGLLYAFATKNLSGDSEPAQINAAPPETSLPVCTPLVSFAVSGSGTMNKIDDMALDHPHSRLLCFFAPYVGYVGDRRSSALGLHAYTYTALERYVVVTC